MTRVRLYAHIALELRLRAAAESGIIEFPVRTQKVLVAP